MSNWRDQIDANGADTAESQRCMEAMWHSYPCLASFFSGEYDEQGVCLCGPGSLTLFVEDGRLKACYKIKSKAVVGFKALPDGSEGFRALERMLDAGEIEWRKEGPRKRS